ncbi:hypothetical protein PHIM7_251 [Sinorhizobium phage phiM7]|uniref:Uncharacterized protein n=2 Tax=Emdodecavirus TaxID=1980937 RepID=S5MQ57_9CAUD|nr:hypothetical protein AB690_gp258 [Sinorhizobium phage phiM12]YP_009601376.1 hypothetical protein FDH46_gp227 [Sinorhizobium phage phiM7]AGR47965.1 hypothetical protein SmphiM12_333 [Sinorhizobium phage phiM12]AKF12796.1 hypothetical protein PHIM7_251 [Sinorhizobium phage phiM7]AKF13157.1 hypothetical protein PHIM19_252 [Sinorhizobium phage phiM19]
MFKDVFVLSYNWSELEWNGNPVPAMVMATVTEVASDIDIDVSDITIGFQSEPNTGVAHVDVNQISLDRRFLRETEQENMKFTLYHELRHFDQYRRGLLDVDTAGVLWMGVHQVWQSGDHYFLTPWERDANAFAISKMKRHQYENNPIFQRIDQAMQNHNAKYELLF